jgi:ankyrin repeat protein
MYPLPIDTCSIEPDEHPKSGSDTQEFTSDPLVMAIKQGNTHQVSQIISEGGVNLNARYMLANWDGLSPLMIACMCGRYDMVELLLESNASIDLQDSTGWSALMHTVRLGHLDIAKLLLHHRANVDLQSAKWESALSLALKKEHSEMITVIDEVVSDLTQ